MNGFSALITSPDPVDTLAARAVHRTERIPPGELALRRAVLESALAALRAGAARARRADTGDREVAWRIEYADDYAWFASPDCVHPFAFASICGVLGLDADAARAAILAEVRDVVVPALPAELPRQEGARRRHERQRQRLWSWLAAQATPWTVREAATHSGLPWETVRGLVSRWVREGLVAREGGRDGPRGWYRVRRGRR